MAKSIYRKTALDRLSSPEQLDGLVPVTDTKAWLALTMMLVTIAAAGVWSVLGSMPSRVSGDGILIIEGGRVFDAVAPIDGVLEEITVAVDDLVEKGQVVAVLSQRELQIQVQSAERTLIEYEGSLDQIRAEIEQEERLRLAALDERIEAAKSRMETVETRLTAAEQRLADQVAFFESGLSTNQRVLERQLEVDGIIKERSDIQGRMAELNLQRIEGNVGDSQRTRDAQRLVNSARGQVIELGAQIARGSAIVAPDAGRVTELQASVGAILGRGQTALSFESLGDGLEMVLYVPPQYGKSVEPGMPVQISPRTAAREEYGTIIGTVSTVSGFPSTVDGMMAVLRNNELVRQFSDQGPPYKVSVALEEDASSTSGYLWTSQRGGALELQSGTLANAEVTIRTQRPIEMVIPLLREWTGL
ncbi:MAG: HlyD family secretion protein [Paracoccaceae bacterium]|jgi:HlyD family secretion protein